MDNLKTAWVLARRAMKNEEGVTALEYGMIAALIAAVIVGTVSTLGTSIKTGLTTISTAL